MKIFKDYKDENEVIKDIFRPHHSDDSDVDEWWNKWNRFAIRLITYSIVGSAVHFILNLIVVGTILQKPLGFWTWLLIVVALTTAGEVM